MMLAYQKLYMNMIKGAFTGTVLLIAMALSPGVVRAMHPLITDDAGTQGKGKFQLEVNGSYSTDKAVDNGSTVKREEGELTANLTYGAAGHLDVFVEMPYAGWRAKADGTVLGSERGLADVSVGAKWRFFEKDGLCLAVKPAVSLPSGDEQKGLGAGKTGYSAYLIATKEFEPAAMFLNAGIIRNENDTDEIRDLWHVSAAVTYDISKQVKLAANIGSEKNPDKHAVKDPVFGLVGIIYGMSEDLDLSFGVKRGLNDADTARTLLAGMAMRF